MAQSNLGRRIAPSVAPLFVGDHQRRPVREGSCVLVRLYDRPFLITAGHVMKAIGLRHIYLGHDDYGLIHLPAPWKAFYVGTDAPGEMDIGLIPLDSAHIEALKGFQFIPDEAVDILSQPYSSKTGNAVFGWPASRSQFRVDRPQRHIRQRSFTFWTDEVAPDVVSSTGYEPEIHLFLKFDPDGVTASAKRRNPPNPRGISGGAAIRVGDNGKLRLAGIMIEVKKNPRVMVATRMSAVVAYANEILTSMQNREIALTAT